MAPRSRAQREAARAASRTRILAAAAALFAERGFHACRVADVAERARMSAGNVYWHFDSKEALLAAIVADGYADLEAMIAAVAGEYGPARRKLELLVSRTITLYERNAALTIIARGLAGGGDRGILDSMGIDVAAVQARCHAGLRRILAEARSEGALVRSIDPDVAATLYLVLFDGLAGGHPRWGAALPRDELRDAALRLVGHRLPA